MKLVDYLRALLSQFVSKKDTGFIGDQAMPKTSSPIVIFDGLTNLEGFSQKYVVPKSGYVTVEGQTNSTMNELYLCVDEQLKVSAMGVNGWGSRASVSAAKGSSIKIDITGFAYARAIFSETMGGANSILNPILQGGLLCLRNTCKLYLKRLSVVRKSGSVISQTLRQANTLTSTLGTSQMMRSGLPPKTATFELLPLMNQTIRLAFILGQHRKGRVLLRQFLVYQERVGERLGVKSRKEKPSLFSVASLQNIHSLSLFQTKVQSNLSFGGALC